MNKLQIIRKTPERKAVAYEGKTNGCVYIPKSAKKGGGIYFVDGTFLPASYDGIGDKVWGKPVYVPLYAGDQLVINKVITL